MFYNHVETVRRAQLELQQVTIDLEEDDGAVRVEVGGTKRYQMSTVN